MTATATRSQEADGRISQVPVVLTLGRFEGRQMVRHPLFWLGVVAAVGLSVLELIEESPVLNRVSMTLAWTITPIAVAVALLAGWAVLRARGRTDAHPPTVMPAPMSRRVAGVAVGLTWPAAATFAVQLVLLAWTLFRDPVTSIVWTELLVGPTFVALAGVMAAAATRWIPHPSTPLVTLLVLAGIHIVVPYSPENWGSQIGPAAVAPIAWPETIIPYEVAFRPSGLHLGYLIGLILALSGVATLGRTKSSWLLLGVGLISASVLGPAQLGPIEESRRVETMSRLVGDEADLTCETHDSVTYCALPGYAGWIDDWTAAVTPIVTLLPGPVEPIEIRQYPVHNTHLLDGEDYDYWWWIPPSYEDYITRDVVPVGSILAPWTLSSELMGHTAARVMGCDQFCEGEAQQVVYLWLLSENPEVAANIEYDTSLESDYASVSSCMIAELWEHSDAASRIHDYWELLTDPSTTYEQAGEALGIDAPAGTTEFGGIEGGCP
jgi:hypothetical protein